MGSFCDIGLEIKCSMARDSISSYKAVGQHP